MPMPLHLLAVFAGFVVILIMSVSRLAGQVPVPKVERVVSLTDERFDQAAGVFFTEGFESLRSLRDRFPDVSAGKGKFEITATDAYSGQMGLEQRYIGLDHYDSQDKGDAGWVVRFFGDSPLHVDSISDQTQQRRIYARWYHKFPEDFNGVVDGKVHYPQKMARMGSKDANWQKMYSVLFWIGDGPEANIAIERHTKIAGAHREWIPKAVTNFSCSAEINRGRWVAMEMAVILGTKTHSDRILAWADGVQICNIVNDDLAAGWDDLGLTFMMWDCYWNGGSAVDQSRFYDNLALSNKKSIGPARTSVNPEIRLTIREVKPQSWEAEVAEGAQQPLKPAAMSDDVPTNFEPTSIVYRTVWMGGADAAGIAIVQAANGKFVGSRAGQTKLRDNTLHFVRVRAQLANGQWSDWSPWHAGFATTWDAKATAGGKLPVGYLAE